MACTNREDGTARYGERKSGSQQVSPLPEGPPSHRKTEISAQVNISVQGCVAL